MERGSDDIFKRPNVPPKKRKLPPTRIIITSTNPNSVLKKRVIGKFKDSEVDKKVRNQKNTDNVIKTTKKRGRKIPFEKTTLNYLNIDVIEDKPYWRRAMKRKVSEAEALGCTDKEVDGLFDVKHRQSMPMLPSLKFMELFGVIIPFVENYNPDNPIIFRDLGKLLHMKPAEVKMEIEQKVARNKKM